MAAKWSLHVTSKMILCMGNSDGDRKYETTLTDIAFINNSIVSNLVRKKGLYLPSIPR